MITRIGAWVDRRGVGPGWREWLDVAREVGLTDVSLVLHAQDAGQPLKPFASAATVARIVAAYAVAGIIPHVMLWPQPRASHCAAMLAYLTELHSRCGSALGSAELDAEEQWTRSVWRLTHGAACARQLREGWPKGLPLAVNGITAALPRIRPLIAIADVVIPQAYTSTRKGQGSTPGKRQDVVAEAWRKVMQPGSTLVMGLAAYSQEGAGGMKAGEALTAAIDACQDETTRLQFWQLPDLAGGPAHREIKARCAALKASATHG